ncbi:hypothetical protein PVAND_006144 [Polypedilum vanderplanki]|uniref:Uncharacterized protein n=1 Tax=Polypedilum vanderplanki TaxID=319348 RepID=A0A9J6C283_POLVA|nr:hypothetical protein PVAND_006144 [Polypedilum vanderplanki]
MDRTSVINLKKESGLPRISSTIRSFIEPDDYITSKMPYADKRFDSFMQYNPPPNELGFLGGLGKRTGTVRSKAHVQRPSANQILFKMRTANRILVSFTEDLALTHSLTRKQLKISPKVKRKPLKQELKELVSQVQTADNIIGKKQGKKKHVSSTSSEDEEIKQEVKEKLKLEDIKKPETEKKKPRITLGAMKKLTIVSAMRSDSAKQASAAAAATPEPKTFREWAMAEREKRFQALQAVSAQQIKQEREANQIFPRVKKPPRKFYAEDSKKKNQLQHRIPGAEHLAGYLYGGFSRCDNKLIDKTMENQTKFYVPLTMFSRAKVESKIRAKNRMKAQCARLEYMKIPQIPSDSDDDDDDSDEVLEDVKGLGLVQTPFSNCRIPAVYTQKKRRIDRLKNKYLKGNRLKRINMLLFDRKVIAEKNKQRYVVEDENENFEPPVRRKSSNISSPRLLRSQESSPQPMTYEEHEEKPAKMFDSDHRQRYHDFLHDKYLEKLEQYNQRLNQKINEETAVATALSPASGVTVKTITDRKSSYRDFSIETMTMSSNFQSATPDIQKDPAFIKMKRKVKKNMKFSAHDNRTGGFYFDPFLLEKIHNPEKGMKIMKNYTSLMRSNSNIRRRLQVNAPTFDEELTGTENDKYYHRLVTEWDSYYINEIRHRPQVKKFNVKSDIIKIREMVRKKFFLFFMEEDLMNLFATQDIENKMIGKTLKFIKACNPQFKQLQDEAFVKAKEKLEMVEKVKIETEEMRKKLTRLEDESDLLMQNLMADERKWEMIMMMQNYYYLLMHPTWRLENDWIHRNKDGQLDFLKKSIVYCKKIHIRSKNVSEISLHAIKDFFEQSIEPKRLDQMRQIKPDVSLLKASLDDMKSNVLGILHKHNEIMLRSSEILFQQNQLEKAIPVIISSYQENMSHIQQKVSFIEKRIEFLMGEVEELSNIPLIKCVKNIFMRKIDAISRHLCKTLFSDTFKIDESIRKHTLTENFCMISNRVLELLGQLDTLPVDILHAAEHESRIHRRNKMRLGKLAICEQNLCQFLEKQLKNHFTPTFQPKRRRKRQQQKQAGRPFASKFTTLHSIASKSPQPK